MNFIKKMFSKNSETKKTNQRQFVGARYDRLTSDWIATYQSLDTVMRSSLKILRARSRDLEINNEYIRAYLRSSVNNVVGKGIPFQVKSKNSSGTLQDSINSKIENEFYHWGQKDYVDVSGKRSFQDIEKLAVRRIETDGEFIIRLVRKPFGESKIPLSLQIIDPDLLDENFNGLINGNEVRMGVEIDEWGRPVAYHFLTYNPGDTAFANNKPSDRIRILAKDIIHLVPFERTNQTRGYPRTNAAMFKLHQLKGFEEAAVVGKRVKASITGFITTPEGELIGDEVVGDERVEDFAPGKLIKLGEGEKVEVPNLGNDTGADTEPFIAVLLRALAATLGVSYETISGDFSKTNYSSSRQALINERDGWRVYQDWLITNFHQRVYEEFLKMAVLCGEIKINDYYTNKSNYTSVTWMPRGWQWVDPAKDVSAQTSALSMGLKTYSEVLAEDGKDFVETVKQIQYERSVLKEHGLSFTNNEQKNAGVNLDEDINSKE